MIRLAILKDASRLAALHTACFAKPWSTAEFLDLLGNPGVLAFLAPEGFVVVRRAAEEGEILTLCVEKAARRQGLATALVLEAAATLSLAATTVLFLEVGATNEAARGLYAKLGFREAGHRRAYYGEGEDALILKARLPLGNLGSSTNIASATRMNGP